jgi:hypothetical protein
MRGLENSVVSTMIMATATKFVVGIVGEYQRRTPTGVARL